MWWVEMMNGRRRLGLCLRRITYVNNNCIGELGEKVKMKGSSKKDAMA
jgi:hypothetical protein